MAGYSSSPASAPSTLVVEADGSLTHTNGAGAVTLVPAPVDEVIAVTAADIGTAAPADAQTGVDPATGAQFYVDAAGLWQAVPVAAVDMNTTISSQAGGNYGGGAAIAPPANPDDGDVHIETYDDRIVYWVAAGGVFPGAPAAQFFTPAAGATSVMTLNGDGSITHDDGLGTQVVIPAQAVSLLTDGVNEFTHTPGDGSPAVTIAQAVAVQTTTHTATVTDGQGVAVTPITRLDACDGVGGAAVLNPLTDQVALAGNQIGQALVDHEGNRLQQGCLDAVLARTMVIGAGHVTANEIGTAHADSDDTAVTDVTTHHLRAVVAAETGTATGARSLVAASINSDATGAKTAVIGGGNNVVSGDDSGIFTGFNHNNTGARAAIVAGALANNGGTDSAIVAGRQNTTAGDRTTIVGGIQNQALFENSAILGGGFHVAQARSAAIVGGNDCDILATGHESAMIGANQSTISSERSVVAGGNQNTCSGFDSVCIGGEENTASGDQSGCFGGGTLGGGNTASGEQAVVIGGTFGVASGLSAAVMAGSNGLADDDNSVSLSGGQANVGGNGTFAHGNGAGGPFTALTRVGFRGAVPQQARLSDGTLATVILALQEQGLMA